MLGQTISVEGFTIDAAVCAPALGTEAMVHFGWRNADLLPVAIKVPHHGWEDSLRQEINTLGTLSHPNIVHF